LSPKVESVEQPIINLLAAISKVPRDRITVDTRLTLDLGLDSVQFMEFLASLEERFPISVEVEDIRPELFHTVQAVLEFVHGRMRDD
jgi:acyl carrier protein